jgi:hypothetical protein
MRIYVASKFENQARVQEVMAQLVAAGHEITYDWTRNAQVSAGQALADVEGVLDAEAFVLIVEKELPYCGALVELGIALGAGIPIYLLGTALNERCIFLTLGAPYIYRGIHALLR